MAEPGAVRVRLAELLNQALARTGQPYSVKAEDIHRTYAGEVQRMAGAGSWWTDAERTGDVGWNTVSIVGFGPMADCVKHGLELTRCLLPEHGWTVDAARPRNRSTRRSTARRTCHADCDTAADAR